MSIFRWPFKRKQYAGIENPRFVGDIVAANEAVLDGLKAICGLNDTDFSIITGLDYVPGIPNTYTPGVFYLNGHFYYIETSFNEGLRVTGAMVDTMPQPFGDGNTRNIYTLNQGSTTTSPTSSSPQFIGSMEGFRLGLKVLRSQIQTLIGILTTLGNAAYKDVGTSAGKVMAADDSRFLGIYNNVLTLDNTGVYTPTSDYHPATKLYADSPGPGKLTYSGYVTNTTGYPITAEFGTLTLSASRISAGLFRITHFFGNLNYAVNFFPKGAGNIKPCGLDKANDYFEVSFADDMSLNDVDFYFQIFKF